MSLLLTGCKIDKNSEGPIYSKYDVVPVYDSNEDTSVTMEDEDDEPVEVDTPSEDHTPENGEGTTKPQQEQEHPNQAPDGTGASRN